MGFNSAFKGLIYTFTCTKVQDYDGVNVANFSTILRKSFLPGYLSQCKKNKLDCPQRTDMSVTHCQPRIVTSQRTLIRVNKTVTSATYRNNSFLSPVYKTLSLQKAYHKQLLSIIIINVRDSCSIISSFLLLFLIIFTSIILYKFLLKPIPATCPVHHILLTLLILTTRDKQFKQHSPSLPNFNSLNGELNPICHLLSLLGAHHILHVSRIRVNGISEIYVSASAHITTKNINRK